MSDAFGLLQIPLSGSMGSPTTVAIGDTTLDKIAAFLKASINADTKVAWAAIHPAIVPPEVTAVPVVVTRTHNPDDGEFTENQLPALFVWRQDIPRAIQYTQEWQLQASRIAVLWVPPAATLEKGRFREPFRNAVAKSIHLSLSRMRHTAWVVAGDTDSKAATWGSFLLSQINASSLRIMDIKPHPLVVQKKDAEQPYDALLVTLELTEIGYPLADDYSTIDHIEGNVTLGTPALTVNSFHFEPAVVSVSPATGGTAGGTAITITGKQFWEDTDVGTLGVTVGGVACTSVVLVDETRITAVTPAGTAGAKTLEVTMPSGATASLASAFTYV